MKTLTVLLLGTLVAAGPAADIHVGRFSASDLAAWTPKSFKGNTSYTLVRDGERTVLRADSAGTASGLFKKVKASTRDYPLLRWSWKVDHVLKREDAHTKQGDDFAARVYAIFPKTFFWQTKALMYVWSAKMPKGSAVPNPYSANAIIIAVESGDEKTGKWVPEERNIYEDYRKYFHEEPPQLGAVAVMTDTDNTGESATAWYGDIFLSGPPR